MVSRLLCAFKCLTLCRCATYHVSSASLAKTEQTMRHQCEFHGCRSFRPALCPFALVSSFPTFDCENIFEMHEAINGREHARFITGPKLKVDSEIDRTYGVNVIFPQFGASKWCDGSKPSTPMTLLSNDITLTGKTISFAQLAARPADDSIRWKSSCLVHNSQQGILIEHWNRLVHYVRRGTKNKENTTENNLSNLNSILC